MVSAITTAVLALTSTTLVGAPSASASTSASIAAPVKAEASVPAPVKAGMNTFMGWYDAFTGLIGPTWWRAAVALSTIETYQQTTGDPSYEFAIVAPFAHFNGDPFAFENNFDDDTAWWGLAWLQAYNLTHNTRYLVTAEDLANYIHEDLNDTTSCGGPGGVWWKRSPHKDLGGAIQNELFLELTAWLHNTIVENNGKDSGKNSYLSWALQEWTWFQHVGLISNGKITVPVGVGKITTTIPANLVTNSITNPKYTQRGSQCSDSISGDLFTYNQGVILAGLAELYKATSNASYLAKAEAIANAALNPKNTFLVKVGKRGTKKTSFIVKGVLTEPSCQPGENCGTGDEGAFKGIFVRDLKMLAEIAPANQDKYLSKYNSFFAAQAASIEKNDTTIIHIPPTNITLHLFGMFWNGPRNPIGSDTQESALEALVASL